MLRVLHGVLCLLILTTTAGLHAEDELLDPEIAFRFSARLLSPDMLEVNYRIADGYYMYRDRYRFSVQPDSIGLGEPRFPAGEWYEDEFFGDSEIYRDEVTIRLPIAPALQSRQAIRLVAVSQGCADVGVCYLPATQFADFELSALYGAGSDQ